MILSMDHFQRIEYDFVNGTIFFLLAFVFPSFINVKNSLLYLTSLINNVLSICEFENKIFLYNSCFINTLSVIIEKQA